jgi:6-phosphogluconolactonase (cycloisomerase 2 family)
MENDGTLTALATSSTGSLIPGFSTVDPGNQYLFVSSRSISEFGIGSDGILTPIAPPTAAGNIAAFTSDGQFVFLANEFGGGLSSYRLDASGVLTPINAVATSLNPGYLAVDGTGRFAYLAELADGTLGEGTISEYTVSSGGALAANGSVSTGGYNPLAVVISPGGFLYCGNLNSGSVVEFSIDGASGALTLVNTYAIWVQPQPGPLWIGFDPSGAYAYIGNGDEVAQFTVDGPTGTLTSNGTTSIPNGVNWGGLDPSGKSVFTANGDGTVTQFIISYTGTLVPNGSVSLGPNMVASTLAFAQR